MVAYALAGSMTVDLTRDPLGTGSDGRPVFLHDIWPSQQEVQEVISSCLRPEMFTSGYADVFAGGERWSDLPTPQNPVRLGPPTPRMCASRRTSTA